VRGVLVRFTSQPLVATASQLAKPAAQVAIPQTPSAQLSFAFGRLHARPQARSCSPRC